MNLLAKTQNLKLSLEDREQFLNYHKWTDIETGNEYPVSLDNVLSGIAEKYLSRKKLIGGLRDGG